MGAVEINADGLQTRDLNDRLRDMMLAGKRKVIIRNVCGQRYIGTRLYSPERHRMEIDVFGTPGNDLAAFLFGRDYVREHPEDFPWTQLSLDQPIGRFTGRKLAHYFTAEGGDYINARRIINSLDCAQKIADYAVVFEAVLRESAAG